MIKTGAFKMIKINVGTLDKNSPIPLYFQLEEILKERIETAELKPGDLLSSEKEFYRLISAKKN